MNTLLTNKFGEEENEGTLLSIYQREGLIFTYHWGGAYIEVYFTSEYDVPFEVINVYDYGQGKPGIVGFDQLAERCKEWIEEVWKEEAENYIANCS